MGHVFSFMYSLQTVFLFFFQEYPNLTTFFDGEIIGEKHPFLTRKWVRMYMNVHLIATLVVQDLFQVTEVLLWKAEFSFTQDLSII